VTTFRASEQLHWGTHLVAGLGSQTSRTFAQQPALFPAKLRTRHRPVGTDSTPSQTSPMRLRAHPDVPYRGSAFPHLGSKPRLALRLCVSAVNPPNLRPSPKKLSPYPDAGNQPLTSAKVGFRGKRRFDRPLATHLFPLPFTQTGLQPITPLLRHPISHPFCVLCVLLRPISVSPLCVSASWR
jgi:hypothetical protein